MEPSSSISSTSTRSPSSSSAKLPDPMDGLLAGAGYNVRSSDLRHVAHQLESLETVMVSSPSSYFSHLANDAVLYNPSDLSSWVDTLLSGVDPSHLVAPACTNNYSSFNNNNNHHAPAVLVHPHNSQQFITAVEEDYSIRLAHGLMTCAQCVHRGDFSLARQLVEELQTLLTRVNSGFGFGKVAGYFIDALNRRLSKPQANHSSASAFENEILYHHFYEACPYLKFAHFTANQAILEAFHGHDHVHVIDFSLMQGLQWPALIQALALRPGGPPALRLTGIGPPVPDGHDSLRDIGLRLAELSRSVNVPFSFRGVAASRLDDVQPWMLQVDPKEAVAVNSIMQLHKLLDDDPTRIDAVLGWIRGLSPKIMTLVEQESNHNQTDFLDRFTEALHYYSTMFDSLEACPAQPEKPLAEIYVQREIYNVVCCEGSARIERHEPFLKWRDRLNEAGFTPLFLGSNAYKQASMLLTLFSAEGYCVEENEGCLTLGWHSRPLIAASAWHVETEPSSPVVV